MDPNNGYFGAGGVPYHCIETLTVEALDYGHESTSEAVSYCVWKKKKNVQKISKIVVTSPIFFFWFFMYSNKNTYNYFYICVQEILNHLKQLGL